MIKVRKLDIKVGKKSPKGMLDVDKVGLRVNYANLSRDIKSRKILK